MAALVPVELWVTLVATIIVSWPIKTQLALSLSPNSRSGPKGWKAIHIRTSELSGKTSKGQQRATFLIQKFSAQIPRK